MSDDHLGQMPGIEHFIDLIPDAKQYRSMLYHIDIHIFDIKKGLNGQDGGEVSASPCPTNRLDGSQDVRGKDVRNASVLR